jgi:hypothetical protein
MDARVFQSVVFSVRSDEETSFADRYRAFCETECIDFDIERSVRTLALMYWTGSREEFCELANTTEDLHTASDWYSAYAKKFDIQYVIEPVFVPRTLLFMFNVPLLLESGFYFTNTVSESGTSSTGAHIRVQDVEANDVHSRSRMTFDELSQYSSAKLPNLPHLKDLGVLRIQNMRVESNFPLYCWLDGKRCLLIPHKTKQAAREYAQTMNGIHTLAQIESPPNVRMICLRDCIVKIEMSLHRVYSKVQKTYYTVETAPEYLQPVPSSCKLFDDQEEQAHRLALCKELLGVNSRCTNKKSYCYGISNSGAIRIMHYKNTESEALHTMPLPQKLSCANLEWLSQVQCTGVAYARLATEYGL